MGFFDEITLEAPVTTSTISEDDYKDIINNAYLRIRGLENIEMNSTLMEMMSMIYFSFQSFMDSKETKLGGKYKDFLILCYFLEQFTRHFDYLTHENK